MGLALGGGGARGGIQARGLKVLDESGIRATCVAGTSTQERGRVLRSVSERPEAGGDAAVVFGQRYLSAGQVQYSGV